MSNHKQGKGKQLYNCWVIHGVYVFKVQLKAVQYIGTFLSQWV